MISVDRADEQFTRAHVKVGILDEAMIAQRAGALWMLASAFLFSLHLAVLKHASLSMHPFQQSFLRNVIAAVCLGGICFKARQNSIKNIPLFALRAVLGGAAGLMLNFANANTPLATVALLFHARIFPLTVLAGIALKERISPARWLAIALGFAGIMIVFMPHLGGTVWSIGMLAASAAALLSSGSQIAVKALTDSNAPITVAAFSQLAFMFLSAPMGLYVWSTLAALDVVMICVAAAASGGAALAAAKAFSLAPASVVSPIDNTGIFLASAMGFIFFNEAPEWNVVVGAFLVFGGAYYVAKRT